MNYTISSRLLKGLALLLAATHTAYATPDKKIEERKIDYAREILPILSDKCFFCHGPDVENNKGDLRLDIREDALDAIDLDFPQDSSLIRRIHSTRAKKVMPPPDSHKELSTKEKDLLLQWIKQGAEYSKHWAYRSPEKPSIPKIKDTRWAKSPIDNFIKAELEKKGLTTNQEAAPHVLARRAALALTGLPPSSAQAKALLNAEDFNKAYEKFVDELLASDNYAEHWSSWWLDKARYADSYGYERDPHRKIWPYRDWVIRAFKQDMPFDQFTIEQLAGDLLPNPTEDQILATAFHRNTMNNTEGGTDNEEFRIAAVIDRTNTTMSVWNGLSWACVQCHSHKYDPIEHKEYFELMAFFNNTADNDTNKDFPVKKFNKTPVPIMEELTGEKRRQTYLFLRGDWLSPDKKSGPLTPNTPKILPPMDKELPKNRLGLAKWLVNGKNPLTARVQVNRIWARVFGTGIVSSLEDMGVQSPQPTHPELLDWLALHWQNDLKWHLKPLLREMVLSSSWRQSSKVRDGILEKDYFNLYYARGPRYRLEAESIRDQTLLASGMLSKKMYGPSVKPYQPSGIWLSVYNKSKWVQSEGEDAYRRSLYTYWKRTSPYPGLQVMDMTSREVCTISRPKTSTPLQALLTMNDKVYIQAAQNLARLLINQAPDNDKKRIEILYQRTLLRQPSQKEIAMCLNYLKQERAHFSKDKKAAQQLAQTQGKNTPPAQKLDQTQEHNKNAADIAATTALCNAVMNLDEWFRPL